MNTEALYLAEVTAYDPALGTTRVLRFANRPFTTKPSESPANTPYEVCLEQPADISRSLFGAAATRGRSTMALGDLVLLNDSDGSLDYINELAFDSRTVTVRRSTKFNPSYPADFTSFVATMEQPECGLDRITLKLRDVFYNVATAPLQTNKYLGNNALPAGLEGTAELAGKAKPVAFGVVKNVPAVPVNTAKLIYQVNDGAVNSIDGVYDRGVLLPPALKFTEALAGPFPFQTAGSSPIQAMTYGGGLFIAATAAGDLYTSPDGRTWTLRASSIGTARAAAYGGGLWLVLTDTHAVTSTNGTSWTNHSPPTLSGTDTIVNVVHDVVYHEPAGVFVLCAQASATVTNGTDVSTSPDGVAWTAQLVQTPGPYRALATGNGMVVGIDVFGNVYSSIDGATWTQRISNLGDLSHNSYDIVFGDDQFVIIGNDFAAVSPDGIGWQRTPIVDGIGVRVVYAGAFIAAGTNDAGTDFRMISSRTGLDWVSGPAPGAFTFGTNSARASNGTNIAVFGQDQGLIWVTTLHTYSTLTDLLDDDQAPMAGMVAPYVGGGYFRLGWPADGIVTADATQGATTASRAAAGLAAVVLARVPGAPTFNSGDLTALAALTSAPLGYWDFDSGATCDAVLDQIAGSVGAAWYPDKSGAFRIAQFTAPSGTPALTLTKSDIKAGTLQRIASNDQGNGIPIYQVVMQYARYYQTITTDIAGEVSDADRAQFAQEWRNAPSTDLSVLTAHPSAGVLTIQSLFAVKADAQTEADRQLALRKVKRDPYELTIELNDETDALDLNSVIEIVHPRYSLGVIASLSGALEGGGLFRILDARPNAEAKELTLTVWGGARYKNLVAADGAYIVSAADGAFIVTEAA